MFDLPMQAEREGAGVRAARHMRVPARWQQPLPPPSDEALLKLDAISHAACRLVMTERRDRRGIEVRPGRLIPQSRWMAG